MYKELLTAYMAENQYLQPRPPAAEEQIEAAENAVGFYFPAELKAVLREFNGDGWLFLSTEEIAETARITREYLLEDYPAVDRHIFFAGNGCGDYYCYNLLPDGTADTAALYIWEHETDETRPVARDIKELIRRYFNDEI